MDERTETPLVRVTELPTDVERLPRVTEVIGAIMAKPELVDYTYYQTVDLIAGLVSHLVNAQDGNGVFLHDGEYIIDALMDGDWLREVLTHNKMTPKDVLNELSEEGVKGHDFLESLARAQLDVDDDAANYLALEANKGEPGHRKAIGNWWIMRQPQVLASEQPVWSNRHGFRGTLDLYWQDVTGKRLITDLKNRKPNKQCFVNHKTEEAAARCHETGAHDSDHVQTGAYFIALQERIGDRIDGRTVLVARKDGTWGEYSSDHVVPSTFLSLLDAYHKLGR